MRFERGRSATPSSSIRSGTDTPMTESDMSLQRSFTLRHDDLECDVFVSEAHSHQAMQLRDRVHAKLERSLRGKANTNTSPKTRIELVSSFMDLSLEEIQELSLDATSEGMLTEILDNFHDLFLKDEDIHTVLAATPIDTAKKSEIIKTYYKACAEVNYPPGPWRSSLLFDAACGKAKIVALFNGQGVESYFEELKYVHNTYHPLIEDTFLYVSEGLRILASNSRARDVYPYGLNVRSWLEKPESTPAHDYLISAPVSFPLIGLLQILRFTVACKILNKSPGDLRRHLVGAAGHSQGIVVATIIASATSWTSFKDTAKTGVETLFWIGCRSQQNFPQSSIPPGLIRSNGEDSETPTPMLSVKGLPRRALEKHIDDLNAHLQPAQHMNLALVNGPRQMVVAGPPLSLYGLQKKLMSAKAANQNESRTPYSQRQLSVSTRFLPITVPFHSGHLEEAKKQILVDLNSLKLSGSALGFPVLDTETGVDLRKSDNVIPRLVEMITTSVVNWDAASDFVGATHIVDFGPGGESGIGSLTSHQKDGTGVRTILATVLEGHNKTLGYASELYSLQNDVVYSPNWAKEFSPRLVRTSDGKTVVETRLSRLLGLPPVMVAGMTPTTVPWDFVAEVMKAGFHIELAGGGFHNADAMRESLMKLVDAMPVGRGITCNLIYANPRAMAWQIPLLAELRKSGVPINGLTIGAGVPSSEIANGYIKDLGLSHISFKPGSKDAIDAVMRIAEANPNFPVILQWTGGRAGGHHSFEDFHEPILEKYSQIRSHSNIILVVGSGFGSAEDTYPYLTGAWSRKYNRHPMPFDGILIGSRVMVSKEAHTSKAAKQAIVDAPGVPDTEWEGTYKKPTGGVLTVRSEMGEPIHKLATRGVKFWAEMDKTIFSLPAAKQVEELNNKKDYIIEKLNNDFQKVWFGRNSQGKPVDIHEMTYAEVLKRCVDLLYLPKRGEWIDPGHRTLVADFARRVEDRLVCGSGRRQAFSQSLAQLNEPYRFLQGLFREYPSALREVLTAHDVDYFIQLCRRPGQKPVPFMPVIDESFEYWFKKDSLWQSERLEAVVDEDVGRVCILHGPVAAQYSKIVNEPVKSILDSIHHGHVQSLLKDNYEGNGESVPEISFLSPLLSDSATRSDLPGVFSRHYDNDGLSTFRVEDDESTVPPLEDWIELLAGSQASWRRALFQRTDIVQGKLLVSNPIRKIFAPRPGMVVQIQHADQVEKTVITLKDVGHKPGRDGATAEIRALSSSVVVLKLLEPPLITDRAPVEMIFKFLYKPGAGLNPIHEVMSDRNNRIKDFYRAIWVGNDDSRIRKSDSKLSFDGETMTVTREAIREFSKAIENKNEAYMGRQGTTLYAPLDFSIVIAWKAIMKCLFPKIVDGDLLRLLHLGNEFQLLDGATPLREGDVVSSTGHIKAIKIRKGSGKVVEAHGLIIRGGKPIILVKSQFILQGTYSDYSTTFEEKDEELTKIRLNSSKDIALLNSRSWLRLNEDVDLRQFQGKELLFRLSSRYSFQDHENYSKIETTGRVICISELEHFDIGTVAFTGESLRANPVIDYLNRHGAPFETPHHFDSPTPLSLGLTFQAPDSSEPYARASGDYNPIHVSQMFASYAGHDSTVIHGMYTSGKVRGLVELHVTQNVPRRMRSWDCTFEGKVCSGDILSVDVHHVGMRNGRMMLTIEAQNVDTGMKVLSAKAEVEQPTTTYVFTGQGSQEKGMGMDLYQSSEVARKIWDSADEYFRATYGFSILDIVRNNPKELTVHFGGSRGKAIRENYMSLCFDMIDEHGNVTHEKVFKEITRSTRSYTYRSTGGLLNETHFTQPALTLMEIARVRDMRAKGMIETTSSFAGHSLGEYAALAAMGEIFTVDRVAALVFYRGLTMQNSVGRDENGATDYSMCAVNPSKVSKSFTEEDLHTVISSIARETGKLLEIVNYNVANLQYVCAGDLRGLDCLAGVMDHLAANPFNINVPPTPSPVGASPIGSPLEIVIRNCLAQTDSKARPLTLQRGKATIPLKVNVPFHSSLLRPGVESFRYFLEQSIPEELVIPEKLIGKYIPNLTAKPFELNRRYLENVYELTQSSKVKTLLANWDETISRHASISR